MRESYSTDLDEELEHLSSGMISSSTLNSPGTDVGMWFVFSPKYNVNNNLFVVQLASMANRTMYVRFKWNSTAWAPWQRIDNFGYNSLAELAAALKPLM